MTGHLLTVADLGDRIDPLLERAGALVDGAATAASARHAALVFFETSLRTRTGFLAACQRLGWPAPVEVAERRHSEVSMPESPIDTLAVLGAWFDVLVVRADRPVGPLLESLPDGTMVVNAGDRGPSAEHPTQALIDAFATTRLVGDLADLHVALCGDLRMRAARSLLELLVRQPPGELTLVTDPALTEGLKLPLGLPPHRTVDSCADLDNIDALHAVGIPHGAAPEPVRARLRVDRTALDGLSRRGLVFSPMPVIDEVASDVRNDPRVAFLRQSALALAVRTAVLETL